MNSDCMKILISLDEKGFCIFVSCFNGFSCVKHSVHTNEQTQSTVLVIRQTNEQHSIWAEISYSLCVYVCLYCMVVHYTHRGDKDRSMKNIYMLCSSICTVLYWCCFCWCCFFFILIPADPDDYRIFSFIPISEMNKWLVAFQLPHINQTAHTVWTHPPNVFILEQYLKRCFRLTEKW